MSFFFSSCAIFSSIFFFFSCSFSFSPFTRASTTRFKRSSRFLKQTEFTFESWFAFTLISDLLNSTKINQWQMHIRKAASHLFISSCFFRLSSSIFCFRSFSCSIFLFKASHFCRSFSWRKRDNFRVQLSGWGFKQWWWKLELNHT